MSCGHLLLCFQLLVGASVEPRSAVSLQGEGCFYFYFFIFSQHSYCSQISDGLPEDETVITWTVNSDRGVSHEEADAESPVFIISLRSQSSGLANLLIHTRALREEAPVRNSVVQFWWASGGSAGKSSVRLARSFGTRHSLREWGYLRMKLTHH